MTPADHAAWLSAWAATWAAIFAGISAAGVIWGAIIATRAAKTWRGVHEAAAADQCVAMAYECLSAVDRVISTRWALERLSPPTSRETMPFPTEAYNDTWAAWRRFRVAHVVATRYYPDRLPVDVPDRLAAEIARLEEWCRSYYGALPGSQPGEDVRLRLVANTVSDAISGAVRHEADQVAQALRPAAPQAWRHRLRAAAQALAGR